MKRFNLPFCQPGDLKEDQNGAFVLSSDFDALEAEAQALRKEVADARRDSERHEIRANQYSEELAALRARVVVLDEEGAFERWAAIHNLDLTVPASPGDYENTVTLMAWEAWKERSRLNGNAVSEGLLRSLLSQDLNEVMAAQSVLSELLGEGKEHD